jgi:hypothetical protein
MDKNPKHLNSCFISFAITPVEVSTTWVGLSLNVPTLLQGEVTYGFKC